MGVDDALRRAGRPRGEQDQRIVVEAAEASDRFLIAGVHGLDDADAGRPERGDHRRVGGVVDHRQSRQGGSDQGFDLERRQARVDRYGTGTEAPDREQLDEELEAIAEGEKHPVTGCQLVTLEARDAARHLPTNLQTIPTAAADRLGEIANFQVEQHVRRILREVD